MTKRWIAATFHGDQDLRAAAETCAGAGLHVDVYSPYPLEWTSEVLKLPRSPMPKLVATGALLGAISGYLLQWFCNAYDWPLDVGGRPPHSLPVFLPITFEMTILIGALAGFFGLLAVLGLPRLWHPLFEIEDFRSASIDRSWLGVAVDPELVGKTSEQLRALGATVVVVAP